ncbi:MAG: hypothetical protein AB2689_05755, partial [Candidatus Thiodiazotropha taylori]
MIRPIDTSLIAALLLLIALLSPQSSFSEGLTELADTHLHWKWNQKEVTEPEQAIKILRDNQVTLAVVTGSPPELALELQELAPDLVVPIYGVYKGRIDWSNWYRDKALVGRVRKALASGRYRG